MSAPTPPRRPADLCPKCGATFGFLYAQPQYTTSDSNWGHQRRVEGKDRGEWLEYRCQTCGFLILGLCADAEAIP